MRHQGDGGRADESWFRHGSRAFAGLLVAAALLGTLAACGSGAVEGPDDEAASDGGGGGKGGSSGGNTGGNTGGNSGGNSGGTNGGGSSGGGDSGGGDEFSWSLPGGDLSTDQIGEAFNRLRAGKCTREQVENDGESAEEWLDFQEPRPAPTDVRRWIFMPPGREELYEAAIAACKGDLNEAQTHLEAASVGTHPGDCRLYKAIRSLLEQRPQESIDCPDPQGESGTPSTESTTTATAESDGSTTESTSTSTSSPASTDASDGDSTSTVGGGTDTAG